MEQEVTCIGIDFAKSRVDLAARPAGDVWRVDYHQFNIESLGYPDCDPRIRR